MVCRQCAYDDSEEGVGLRTGDVDMVHVQRLVSCISSQIQLLVTDLVEVCTEIRGETETRTELT